MWNFPVRHRQRSYRYVKAEKRNTRIKELFDERINDIQQATNNMNEIVIEKIRQYSLESRQILNRFSEAIENSDYSTASKETLALARFLKIDLGYNNFYEFNEQRKKGTINWDM